MPKHASRITYPSPHVRYPGLGTCLEDVRICGMLLPLSIPLPHGYTSKRYPARGTSLAHGFFCAGWALVSNRMWDVASFVSTSPRFTCAENPATGGLDPCARVGYLHGLSIGQFEHFSNVNVDPLSISLRGNLRRVPPEGTARNPFARVGCLPIPPILSVGLLRGLLLHGYLPERDKACAWCYF